MKIKKLLAGLTAAALTATSLAVVNVSAAEDKTVTHSFIHKSNTLTFTYTKTISARAGADLNEFLHVEATDVVDGVTGKKAFQFGLLPGGVWVNDYDAPSTAALETGMANPAYDGLGTIKVKGYYYRDADKDMVNPISTEIQTQFTTADNGQLMFYGVVDTATDHFVGDHELDLGRIQDITEITVTQNFKKENMNFEAPTNYKVGYYDFGKAYVSGNACSDAGFQKFLDAKAASDKENYWPFTNKITNVGGREIVFDTVYSLENNQSVFTDEDNKVLYSGSSVTFLQWVNDTIGYNKGAKIKFYFAEGAKDNKDTLETWGSSTVGGQRPWFTVGNATDATHKANDAVLVVNGHSTNMLRQEVVMTKEGNNYVAEFDWDTVMAASPTTTTGHVSSISFALNNGGINVNKIPGDNVPALAMKSNPNAARLVQIDIVVPGDQPSNLPSNITWDNQVTKVEDPNSGVIAEGTNAAITGNGGVILKAVGKLTTNNLTYELKLIDKDGNYVQPAGEITLTLPLPKDTWGRTIKGNQVTHTKNDGTTEKLDIINKDTYATDHFVKVVTTSFSSFGIDFDEEEETTVTEAPVTEPTTEAPATEAPATTEGPAGNTNQPTPDKNTPATGFAIALVPAAIAAAAAVVSKKRK